MELLEVLEGMNSVLAKAYSATQTPTCILNLNEKRKWKMVAPF